VWASSASAATGRAIGHCCYRQMSWTATRREPLKSRTRRMARTRLRYFSVLLAANVDQDDGPRSETGGIESQAVLRR
jgi:hypothetical protein